MHIMARLFILVVFLWSPLCVHALEWQDYGFPGASVRSLTANPGRSQVVLVGYHMLYRSLDQGRTWRELPLLPSGQTPRAGIMLADPQSTLLIAAGNGVYYWNNASNAWTLRNQGLTDGISCNDLSVSGAGRIFLGCSNGLYYSDNAGLNWTKIPFPLSWENLPVERAVADRDGSVYIKVMHNNNIFRVESDLVTHTFLSSKNGFPFPSKAPGVVIPNPDNPDQLLMITDHRVEGEGKVYYSSDRGENWIVPSGGALPDKPLTPIWLLGKPMAVTDRAAYELRPHNLTWSLLWSWKIPDHYSLLDLGGDNLLLGNSNRGVWRSTNRGTTWDYSSAGMRNHGQVRAIAVAPDRPETLFVGFSGHGVWRTRNDGKTWEALHQGFDVDDNLGITIRALAVNPFNPDHLIAGTEVTHLDIPSLYVSMNAGQTWSKIALNLKGPANRIYFVRKTPGVVLVGTAGDAIWRSSDNGVSFTQVANRETFRNVLDFTEESGGRIFAGLVAGFERINGYAYSDDQGATWTAVADFSTTSLAADPVRPGRIMLGSGSAWMDTGGGMRFTSNNAATWTPVNAGIPYSPGYYQTYDAAHRTLAHPAHPGTYFLLMRNVALLRTVDEGASWARLASSEHSEVMEYSPRKGGTLFLGTSSGVKSGLLAGGKAGITPGVMLLLLEE